MGSLETLAWIVGSGLAMAGIALSGGLTLLLPEATLRRWIAPLVSLAAGALLGGALLHMLPHAVHALGHGPAPWLWTVAGFALFLAVDQLLEWHHCHRAPSEHVQPLTVLLLVADALHNFLGGLAVGAVFTIDIRAGLMAWFAAALHEVPQELGDFGVLVHGGWGPRKALTWNLISGLTFPLGGVIAWGLGAVVPVGFLVALGAGNFLYIAGADLVPEFKRSERLRDTGLRFAFFLLGAGALAAVLLLFGGHGHA
ncbi:MAG: ZIP family metal transporter [Myxococcota bacterium]